MRTKTYFICFIAILSIFMLYLSGCLFRVSKRERARLYSYYSNDNNYVEVVGKLIYCRLGRDDRIAWVITFDEDFVFENEDTCKMFRNNPPYDMLGKIDKSSQEILNVNGFYDLIIDPDYKNSDLEWEPLLEAQVTVISCPRYWWEGWDLPIVAVNVGDTVYLDFETGKANFLDWIQNDLR